MVSENLNLKFYFPNGSQVIYNIIDGLHERPNLKSDSKNLPAPLGGMPTKPEMMFC